MGAFPRPGTLSLGLPWGAGPGEGGGEPRAACWRWEAAESCELLSPGPRASRLARPEGPLRGTVWRAEGERWKRMSPRPVSVAPPGAAGERVARPQIPQQVLPAALRDLPPCAHAELGREADGDAACGAVARTFTCAVSPRFFFFLGRAGALLPSVRGTLSLLICRWCSVDAVCPWY